MYNATFRLGAAAGAVGMLAAVAAGQSNLLLNAGFESDESVPWGRMASDFVGHQGTWGVEQAEFSGTVLGVHPHEGAAMLHASPRWGFACQPTDVSALASVIDAGTARFELGAVFNAAAGGAPVGAVKIHFFSAPGWQYLISAPERIEVPLDADVRSWTEIGIDGSIPVGTRWILSQVWFDDPAYRAHGFADAAFLRVIPAPGSVLVLSALGLACVIGRRRPGAGSQG